MSELETRLRGLAKNGELTYLSLVPVAGKGELGIVFHATVSPASKFGNSDGRDADPVEALLKAINGLSKDKPKVNLQELLEDAAATPPVAPWDITS